MAALRICCEPKHHPPRGRRTPPAHRGAAVAYFGFNGFTVSTLSDTSFSQIAFDLAVTPALITTGLIWALALGAIGGLFPAVRAATLPDHGGVAGD